MNLLTKISSSKYVKRSYWYTKTIGNYAEKRRLKGICMLQFTSPSSDEIDKMEKTKSYTLPPRIVGNNIILWILQYDAREYK